MRRTSVLRALAAMSLAGCGGGGSDAPTAPTGGGTAGVTVGNFFFAPASLSVATGTTVTWTWAMGDTVHTVTFDDGAPGSAQQSSGTFQRTFATAGTYTYFCSVHGRNVMSGAVTVSTGGSTGGGGSGGGGGGGGGYP